MDTKIMAQRIVDAGFTQSGVAKMIEARGVKCNQTTVHRILQGSDPSYTLGDALRRVYMDVCERQGDAA